MTRAVFFMTNSYPLVLLFFALLCLLLTFHLQSFQQFLYLHHIFFEYHFRPKLVIFHYALFYFFQQNSLYLTLLYMLLILIKLFYLFLVILVLIFLKYLILLLLLLRTTGHNDCTHLKGRHHTIPRPPEVILVNLHPYSRPTHLRLSLSFSHIFF